MKDRIEDLKLLLQNDRRIWAVIGFFILALLIVFLSHSPNRSFKQGDGSLKAFDPLADEEFKDLIQAYEEKLYAISQDNRALKASAEQSQARMQNIENTVKDLFAPTLDRIDNIESMMDDIKNRPVEVAGGNNTGMAMPKVNDRPATFGLEEATVPLPPPAAKVGPKKMAFIAPGDSVRVRLLTGVNAPVDGTPYPVVFRLSGPISGPDGSTLDLGEARLLAAAQGSETDGRAIFRLTSLALRHKDGRRSVVNVDGWVVGEDGIRGMQGKVIDKLGQLILATAGTTVSSALLARATDTKDNVNVSNSANIEVTSADVGNSVGQGILAANNRLVDVLIDRLEQLVPVVEILSGREAAAIFSSPVEVYLCEENCADVGDESIYTALD